MQIDRINAPAAPQPLGAYSQAVQVTGANRTLYISGQPGMEVDGSFPADIAGQAELAWRNLGAQLAAAGMGFRNIVKMTFIFVDRADLAGARPAREAAMGDDHPATTVIIAGLVNPAWRIEIEAVACA